VTALAAVAAHIPDHRVPIEELADEFGLTPMKIKVFRRYHKLGEVRADPDGSLLDLLRGAVAGLDLLRGREHLVRYVLYARSFPVVVPYPFDPVGELCREFGLEHANVFAIGQHACASGLLAIDVAGRLLAADAQSHPDALALVLTGEKAFTGDARMVPDTTFFGEGAAACLVSACGDRDRLLSYATDLRGEFDQDSEEVAMAFQLVYPDSLADAITAAVDRAGLRMDEITLILPHNVNEVAWQRVCQRLDYPIDRVVLDNVATYGHMFCADTLVNYETARQRRLLHPGDRYVMAAAGAGLGATFSAMVFEH
jgi:3-oxoacyl-[acyl-carrier-protein] synthase III